MVKALSKQQIRDGWQMVRFGEIAREVKVTCKSPTEKGLEYYLGLEHLDPQSLQVQRKGIIAEDNPSFTRRFKAGQILFGKRRCYQKKTAVPDFDGICSGDIIVMEAVHGKVVSELLPFIVQSDMFFDWAVKTSSGSLSPRTKWKSLAEFEFPLPPVERQKELIELFNKNEAIKNKANDALRSIETLKKVLLHKIFTVNDNDRSWKKIKLKSVADFQNGKAFPSKDYSEYGVKLLRPGNITANGKVEWSERATTCLPQTYWDENKKYRVFENELVMNLTAQSLEDDFLGRVCRTTEKEKCILNQRIARIVPKRIESNFLFWALQSPLARNHINLAPTGTKVKHLYNRDIESIPIYYPEDTNDQKKIGNLFDEIEKTIDKIKTSAKKNSRLTIAFDKILLFEGKE